MSRHRNVRKIKIEDEMSDDAIDCDYTEDEEELSPNMSQFLYRRTESDNLTDPGRLTTGDSNMNLSTEKSFLTHEYEEMVTMNTRPTTPKTKKKPKTPGKNDLAKASVVSIDQLKIYDKPPARTNSCSPLRQIKYQPSNLQIALSSIPNYRHHTRPEGKLSINLVIIGHVDAGKSTLVGHLLYLLGLVDEKQMHRHKQEALKSGKSSFAFAWIFDELDEERNRGVTMDTSLLKLTIGKKDFNIIDAPGHKDFIPEMILGGASKADAAILVVNATKGEFETGFDHGGQTREHAMIIRALGVSHLIVCVNKMDNTNGWSQERYHEIKTTLSEFFQKKLGFEATFFVPVSGLLGINLIKNQNTSCKEYQMLRKWYQGPCLTELLDSIAPVRTNEQLQRIVINSIQKCSPSTLSASAKVESGYVELGDRIFILPDAIPATVKAISAEGQEHGSGKEHTIYFAGDHIQMILTGEFEPDSIHPGYLICRGGQELLIPTRRFIAKIVTFDIKIPIIPGSPAELFTHSLRVPCTIQSLRAIIDKSKKAANKERPRLLTKNTNALVEITTELPICVEPFTRCKATARIALRGNGETLAAGIVEEIL